MSATDRLNAGTFELEVGGTEEVVNVVAVGGELQSEYTPSADDSTRGALCPAPGGVPS